MKVKNFFIATLFAALTASTFVFVSVSANHTTVVTPTNQQGFNVGSTRGSGGVNFVVDADAPGGDGALQLTTAAGDTNAIAQYLHNTNTALADVTELSYYTKQVSGSPAVADPAYQLAICAGGFDPAAVTATNPSGCVGFTTLVFEPYLNPGNNGNATIVPDVYQQYDVDQGMFFSTRNVTCSNGALVGSSGFPLYTLDFIKAACPNAVVFRFGVNIGSNNPGYTVRTDLLNFNGTIYDFEPDSDGDGIGDGADNCPADMNTDQEDTDGDGIGNVCDTTPDDGPTGDTDGDGDLNNADNCPTVANPNQLNTDGDAFGNACDTDDDNDGDLDTADNCPLVSNPDQADADNDGIGDSCDTAANVPTNKDQCKNGGWMNFTRPDGTRFRNQGDCISFVNTGR